MRRRANLEPIINHERWLVSYADFVTLLFAFFVVMYSISQVSENKYRQLAETLDEVFSSSKQSVSTASDKKEMDQKNQQARLATLANMENLREEVLHSLSGLISQGSVTVSGDESWTEIALDSELMFASGQANLSKESMVTFVQLGNILSGYENMVAVGGHTDNVPINNVNFANNWELSAARAVSVVSFLSSRGVKPQRLTAVGYGEFHPLAANDTAEGRSKNRRVVLRVTNTISASTSVESPKNLTETNRAIESSVVDEFVESPQVNTSATPNIEPAVKPLILKDGSLLFTSDPNLPRINNPTATPSSN